MSNVLTIAKIEFRGGSCNEALEIEASHAGTMAGCPCCGRDTRVPERYLQVDLNALRERISDVCYQHVAPHVDRYAATPDLTDCLPLMEPEAFAGFAGQACIDVTEAVLQVRCVNARLLQDRVTACLSPFGDALDRYASELERFRQMLERVPGAAFERGLALGDSVGQIARGLFGNLGLVAVALAGGYFGGRSFGKRVDAEGLRLQEAFRQMLLAYDQAMEAVVEAALGFLDG